MKIKFGDLPYIYPIPITLVGTQVQGKPNYSLIGDVGLMGVNPALVYVSSHQDHYTNQGILETGGFSINVPDTDLLALADYCGRFSGREVDKSGLFEAFYGELGNVPLIQECPVNLECRVVKEFSIQQRQIFIGAVVQCYVSEEYVILENGRKRPVDLTQLDPILYALDNRYYKVGPAIGREENEWKRAQS